MRRSGVYRIRNKLNGNRYIGSSTNLAARWSQHKCDLRKGVHHSKHLQHAWNAYGEDAFAFEIIIYAQPHDLERQERVFLEIRPEYNYATDPRAPHRGKVLSQEMKDRIAATVRGTKRSEQTRQRMKEARARHSPHSPETLAKISASKKNSEATRRAAHKAMQASLDAVCRAVVRKSIDGTEQLFVSLTAAEASGLYYQQIREALLSGKPAKDGSLWRMADGSVYKKRLYTRKVAG